MTQAAAVNASSGRTQYGRAWHQTVSGLHVAKVSGTFREMGHQHGVMLGDAVRRGPIPYYKDYVARMMSTSRLRPVVPLLWQGLRRTVGRRVANAMPEHVVDALRGLSEGAQIPYDDVLDGAVMPDTLMWCAARLMNLKRVGPALHHRLALGLGCTSAIAWGDATHDGKLLHSRNLDYHGVSCWPQTASVLFYEPDDGMRYVSVAAAGVVMGGITSMNEAGLTLTVHQHMFTASTALGGTPIGVVGDIVMRKATSLDEAQAILEAHTPIGCWTYLVADGKTREVLCYEEDPHQSAAIRTSADDTTFNYANIYLDKALGKTERALYGSYWRANEARHRRAKEILTEKHGGLTPTDMAGILGDSEGVGGCRLSDPICMLMTVGSVVFSPEDGVVWVSTGDAPTSQNRFEPFSLHTEGHAPELGALEGHIPEAGDATDAFLAYRDAYLAYFDEGDLAESRQQMARASELQPNEPLYHSLGGLLALRDEDPKAAVDRFDEALALGHPHPQRIASFYLWRGRAYDAMRERRQAVADYEAALAFPVDLPIAEAARKGLRRRQRSSGFSIDFAFADVMAP